MQINPQIVRQSIENIKVTYPDLVADDEAWLSALESETDFNELLTSIVRRIDDMKALVIGTKDRFEELKARKDRFEFRIDKLREIVFSLMQSAELAKVELPEATLSLRAGTPQLIGDADANDLPDELCKISRAVDRTAVKDALKTGKEVPGFSLSNSPPSLTIRIK